MGVSERRLISIRFVDEAVSALVHGGVGVVGPAGLRGMVGAVKELPGCFVEVVASLVWDDEFDGCGMSDLHVEWTVLTHSGDSRSQYAGCVAPC